MAKFTRSHYEKVADFIKTESYRVNNRQGETELDYLYDCMVRMFSADNPRFKEHLFSRASGRAD